MRSRIVQYCYAMFAGLLLTLSLGAASAELSFYNAYKKNVDLLFAEIVDISGSRARILEIRGLRKRKARALGASSGFVFGVHDLKDDSFVKLGNVKGNVESFVVKRFEDSDGVWFSILNDGVPSVFRLKNSQMIFDEGRSEVARNLKGVELFLSNGQLSLGIKRLSGSSVISLYGPGNRHWEDVDLKNVYVSDIWSSRKGEIYLLGNVLKSEVENSTGLWAGRLKRGEKYTVEEVSRAYIKGSLFGLLEFLPVNSGEPIFHVLAKDRMSSLSLQVYRLFENKKFVRIVKEPVEKLDRIRMIDMAGVCLPYLFVAEVAGEEMKHSFHDYADDIDRFTRTFRLPAKVISRVGVFVEESALAVVVSYSKLEERRRSDGWYGWDGYTVYFVQDDPCYSDG